MTVLHKQLVFAGMIEGEPGKAGAVYRYRSMMEKKLDIVCRLKKVEATMSEVLVSMTWGNGETSFQMETYQWADYNKASMDETELRISSRTTMPPRTPLVLRLTMVICAQWEVWAGVRKIRRHLEGDGSKHP